MIIVCSGCEGKMGEKEPLEDKRVSHGICRECLVRIYGVEYVRTDGDGGKAPLSSLPPGIDHGPA